MAVGTTCPSCGKTLRVDPDLVGRHVRCPDCREKFRIEHVEFGTADGTLADEAALNTIDDRDAIPESSAPTLPGGGTLGRFELQSVLGGGGFGVVYRAVDTHMGREVALKIPRFGPGESNKVRRFLTEARTAARLRHPHIVPVFESGEVEGTPFIAAEFVPGETLASGLKRGRPDPTTTVRWVRQLAEALAYAHDEGIVHRDVKPDNVMLDDRGRPQLMDFGLAKRIDEDSSMTADGSVLGTPSYMSPEQARGESDRVGPLSDQYSLGVVMYELLTGRRPFEGSPHAVIAQVAKDVPPAPRSLDVNIPADVEAMCQKAMEKDPSRRYANCAEFAADLERWSNGEPIVARPIGPIGRLVRWCKREPAVAGLAGAVMLVATIGFIAVTALWGRAQANLAEARTQRERAEANAQTAADRQVEAEAALAEVETTKEKLADALAESEKNLADAERLRGVAQTNAEEAARRQKEAEFAAADLEKALGQLKEQTRLADASTALAARRQREVRLGVYLKDVNSAQLALRNLDAERCRELLAKHLPRDGAPDFRSVDWYYLLHASTEFLYGTPAASPILERPRKKEPPPATLRADRNSLGHGVTAINVVFSGGCQTVGFRRTTNQGRHSELLWSRASSLSPFQESPDSWPDSARKLQVVSSDEQPCLFARDGTFLVGWGDLANHQIKVVRLENGRDVFRPSLPIGALRAPLALSPDGQHIVGITQSDGESLVGAAKSTAVDFSKSLISVRTHEGREVGSFRPYRRELDLVRKHGEVEVASLVFSPDGTRLLVLLRYVSTRRFVTGWLLQFEEGRLTSIPHAGLAGVRPNGSNSRSKFGVNAVFAPDGSAVAIYDHLAWTLLDLATGEAHSLSEVASRAYMQPLGRFSPDGRTFVVAGVKSLNVSGSIRDSSVLRGTKHMLVIISRTADGPELVREFEAHGEAITGLEIAPDGRAFLTSSRDKTVRIWDTVTGQERLRFDSYTTPVTALALSEDGTLIATGDDRGSVTVWSAPTEVPDSWKITDPMTPAESRKRGEGVLEEPKDPLGSDFKPAAPGAPVRRRRSSP